MELLPIIPSSNPGPGLESMATTVESSTRPSSRGWDVVAAARSLAVRSRRGSMYGRMDGSQQIRLCTIFPGSGGAVVHVKLRVARLSDCIGAYRCLSYVWGSNVQLRPMFVNGFRHAVTPNLDELLRWLRALGFREEIWVDALCIRQDDEVEKALQVNMMANIFSGAKEIYIGIDDIGAFRRRHLSHRHVLARQTIDGLVTGQHLRDLPCFAALEGGGDSDAHETFEAFRQLLDSAWFRRTWTVQEVCRARQATLLCSWGLMPWLRLAKALDNWDNHRRSCCSDFASSLGPDVMEICFRTYCHVRSIVTTTALLPDGLHILRPMLLYQHLAATDPRDKVYAFRGLHTVDAELPKPDYTKGKDEVFMETTLWLLEDQQSLLVLCLDFAGEDESLPSWVADWSAPPIIDRNFQSMRLNVLEVHNAAKDMDMSIEYVAPRTLRLRGLAVDEVEAVTEDHFALGTVGEHLCLWKDWCAFASLEHASMCPKETMLDDDGFCEVMLGGCVEDEQGTRAAQAADLAAWRHTVSELINSDGPVSNDVFQTPIMESHIAAILERRLFRTRKGNLGLGPKDVTAGDMIWVLGGGRAPFMLRPVAGAETATRLHSLVGHGYVCGLMQGEALVHGATTDYCCLT